MCLFGFTQGRFSLVSQVKLVTVFTQAQLPPLFFLLCKLFGGAGPFKLTQYIHGYWMFIREREKEF